jgi:hypothetical protein
MSIKQSQKGGAIAHPKVIPIRKAVNEYYDNSMLGAYKRCPRQYYFQIVRGWRGEGISLALVNGLAWHSAMNIIWQGYGKMPNAKLVDLAMQSWNVTWVEEGMPSMDEWNMELEEKYAPRTPGTAREMLTQYLIQREGVLKSAKLENAEQPFAVPVFPDQPNIWYIGRKDKKILLQGDHIILEHKTTSEYKIDGGFKSQYLEGWSPNSQCEGYLYDSRVSDKVPARYIWVDAALVHKKVHDKFKFIPISASGASLDAFLWEMRDWIQRIRGEVKRLAENSKPENTHMVSFPKNTEQCQGKYGLCSFISICRTTPRPDLLTEPPPGYVYKPWQPFDILQMEKIGMKK